MMNSWEEGKNLQPKLEALTMFWLPVSDYFQILTGL